MSRRGVSQKRKVVGSDGKLVSQPTDGQQTWTNRYGTPVGTPAFVGYDYRFQSSPEEAEALKANGFYSRQWRELRSKK
jgi:hypothetical protein